MALTAFENPPLTFLATLLVGRNDEITRLRAMLERPDVRLVTLLGPGGVGKTRVALQVMQALEGTTIEPRLVLLSTASTADEAMAAIARALGAPYAGQEIATQVIADTIGQRSVLLILDNVEQLADHLDALPLLMAACSNLRILATSRVPLRFSAERVFPIEPLATHASDEDLAPASVLFIDRAQAVRPDLDLSPEGLAAIDEICRRLDGLPLAIELAAARSRFLPPAQLLDRLPSRLQVLEGGPRDAPERHRTLRATIAWSYDLLNDLERRLFQRLAVFANGGPLEAVGAVCDATGDLDGTSEALLESLVDHSLVRLSVPPAGQPRFRILHTIREFALEQLAISGSEEDVRLAHARWFAAQVIDAPPATWRTGTPELHAWVTTYLPDADNLTAALQTLTTLGDDSRAVGMAGTLMSYWSETGEIRAAEHWMRLLESREGGAPPEYRARFQRMRAVLCVHQKDLQAAEEAARLAIALNEQTGDSRMAANNRHLLGQVLWNQGRLAEAEVMSRQAMDAMIASGDPLGGALYAAQLADGLMERGDLDQAETLLMDAEPVVMEHRPGAAPLLHGSLGILHLLREQFDTASTYLERSLAYHEAPPYRNPFLLACRLETIGYLAMKRGLHQQAVSLLATGMALLERTGGSMDVVWQRDMTEITTAARAALSAPEYERAWATGAAMVTSLETAVNLAREILAIRDGTTTGASTSDDLPAEMALLEEPLTPREFDVLRLLAAGRSNPDIAAALFISPRTVTTHLSRMYAKLEVSSRTGAVARATQLGIIRPASSDPT